MIKVNREELIAMLEEVRMRLPKEIAESKRIVKTKDSIIADAKSKRTANHAGCGKRSRCDD